MTTGQKLVATVVTLAIGIGLGMFIQWGLQPEPRIAEPQVHETLEMLPRDSGIRFGKPHRIVTQVIVGFTSLASAQEFVRLSRIYGALSTEALGFAKDYMQVFQPPVHLIPVRQQGAFVAFRKPGASTTYWIKAQMWHQDTELVAE